MALMIGQSGAQQYPLAITTGNMLQQECLDAQRVIRAGSSAPEWPFDVNMNSASCVSFLIAIYQLSGRLAQAGTITPVCDWGIRTDQLVDVFLNFSNAHPEMRSLLAADLVLAAIVETFRCPVTDWPKPD